MTSVWKGSRKPKIRFKTSRIKTSVCKPILIKQSKCSRNASKKFKSKKILSRILVNNTRRRSKPDNYNRCESARMS